MAALNFPNFENKEEIHHLLTHPQSTTTDRRGEVLETKKIIVDSFDNLGMSVNPLNQGNLATNWKFSLRGCNNVKSIKTDSLALLNTFYNVQQGLYNDLLSFYTVLPVAGARVISVPITSAFWSLDQILQPGGAGLSNLSVLINNAILAVDPTADWTIQFSAPAGGFTYRLRAQMIQNGGAVVAGPFYFVAQTSFLRDFVTRCLGFPAYPPLAQLGPLPYVFPANSPYIGPGLTPSPGAQNTLNTSLGWDAVVAYDLAWPKVLYLYLDVLDTSVSTSDLDNPTVASLLDLCPITVPYGFLQTFSGSLSNLNAVITFKSPTDLSTVVLRIDSPEGFVGGQALNNQGKQVIASFTIQKVRD